MGGKVKDPDYWKKYRASHPQYAARDKLRRTLAKKEKPRNRVAEYRNRNLRRVVPIEPIPMLYPELQRGTTVSFWEDELKIDLEQERVLAILEGRDPEEAVRQYKAKELSIRMRCTQYTDAKWKGESSVD